MTLQLSSLTLEDVFAGRGFADIPASPLQLAIARAARGQPLNDVIDPDACERFFGVPALTPTLPTLVVLIAGVRGGKSWLAASAAIHACLTADLSQLQMHELP